eukprot:scaffold11274_cov79-Phaeocystis_antarctica.AAC.5
MLPRPCAPFSCSPARPSVLPNLSSEGGQGMAGRSLCRHHCILAVHVCSACETRFAAPASGRTECVPGSRHARWQKLRAAVAHVSRSRVTRHVLESERGEHI